jgi:hypothetical protein
MELYLTFKVELDPFVLVLKKLKMKSFLTEQVLVFELKKKGGWGPLLGDLGNGWSIGHNILESVAFFEVKNFLLNFQG